MRKYKIRIFLCYIGIILTVSMIVFTTYTYINLNKKYDYEDYNAVFKKNTNILFNDTSNLSIINKSDNKYTKTFSIENLSENTIYYDILLDNVVNSYENKDSITYKLLSNNGAYIDYDIYPSEDKVLVTNVELDKKDRHEYTLEIYINNDEKDKTLSSSLSFKASKQITNYLGGSLGKYIKDNSSVYVEEEYEEGIFYINSSINGSKIYFFRGSDNLNNNVILGDNCYKILRTTINGGIRIIYNGILEDGVCSNKKVLEELSPFNNKYNYNAYVGYMYGDASSDNYNDEHKNINSSIIKLELEKWYKDNISKYNSLIEQESIYCNYRITNSFNKNGVSYTKLGYSNNNTGYYGEKYPSYNCRNINDRLSVNNSLSSKVLNYPVGLITVDELLLSGFNMTLENGNNFLYTNDSYFTMTSAYYNRNGSYNYSVINNKLTESRVDTPLGVRPVITLNRDILIKSGDGSIENPFMIKED